MNIVRGFWGMEQGTDEKRSQESLLCSSPPKITPCWSGLKKSFVIGFVMTAALLLSAGSAAHASVGRVVTLTPETTDIGSGPVGEKSNQGGKDYEALKILQNPELLKKLTLNPSAPEYDLKKWTKDYLANLPDPIDPDGVGPNCYAYAVNAPHMRDPGGSADKSLLPKDGSHEKDNEQEFEKRAQYIIAGATFDGLEFIGAEPRAEPGKYLVAYFQLRAVEGCQQEGVCTSDYHFVRQDKSGFWSHKPGKRDVTQLDSDGHVITDPRTANISAEGRQYDFVGFLLVPEGGIAPNGFLRSDVGNSKLRQLVGPQDELRTGEGYVARFVSQDNPDRVIYLQKGEDNTWCHAPGFITNGNKDSHGNIIRDPEKAYIKTTGGITYVFDGYFAAPNGDVLYKIPSPDKSVSHSSQAGLNL